MKRGTYFRLLVLSLFSALILSALSLFLLNRLTDLASSRHRNEFISFFVENIERKISTMTDHDIRGLKSLELLELPIPFRPPRGFPPGPRPGPPPGVGFRDPPPGGGPGGGPPRPEFWLVTESGEILSGSTEGKALPKAWDKLPKSAITHEISTLDDFLHLSPSINVIKLNRTPTMYFIFSEDRRPFFGPLFLTQAALTFASIMMALVFSFSLVFFYLRKKSEEARAVLLRLERGDLKARFEIQRFDEFGGLLLDFNRMAHEIERLVSRVHATETTRKNLLQELGHDLRTPLTSLATSFETLRAHYDKMTQKDRDDLFEMTAAEVEYFKDLLEKLMTIATLDEPNYKESTELVDLRELIDHEVRSRQSTSKLNFTLSQALPQKVYVSGDAIMILRLLKNALENACRYAKSRIDVALNEDADQAVIIIKDDGPGLSVKELDAFAKRRDQRTRREGDKLHFSLGLGSVIMKAITELHDGKLEIKNTTSSDGNHGAELTITLPKAQSAKK